MLSGFAIGHPGQSRVHLPVYIYIYIYIHTHTHTYVCVCVCVCVTNFKIYLLFKKVKCLIAYKLRICFLTQGKCEKSSLCSSEKSPRPDIGSIFVGSHAVKSFYASSIYTLKTCVWILILFEIRITFLKSRRIIHLQHQKNCACNLTMKRLRMFVS